MSSSTSKRQRSEENIEDENKTEESSGGFTQEILVNGNTLVFSTLIPMMKDVGVLQTCRLVCKSWNIFACESLRKLPWVYYSIREASPRNVNERLELLAQNNNLRLPSPFKNFRVHVQSLRVRSFLRFFKYVRDNKNNYSIELCITSNDGDVDPVQLHNVLTSNPNNFNITKLVLSGKIIQDGPDLHMFQPERIRLLHLTSIIIKATVLENDKIMLLCEQICHYSPIKMLSISIDEITAVEKLKKMMSTERLKSVERMYLNFEDEVYISVEDWEYVCTKIREIPCIKKTRISMGPNYDDRYFNEIKTVIEHFADSLEYVAADLMPVVENKCFPELREICVECFSSYKELYYPVERYPLLRKVTISTTEYIFEDPCVDELSLGIEELDLMNLGGECLENPEDMFKLICGVGMVLPNVKSFSIDIGENLEFTSAILMAICKSFPNLTALDLDVDLKENRILSGLRDFMDVWLVKGWPLEKIPRDPCLLDFKGLEKLSLGPDVVVTTQLFTYCLSKIPKLEYLTFYWKGDFSAVEIRESVGHLKRITAILPANHKKQWVEEMERLRVMLPAVAELKRSKESFEKLTVRF